MADRIERIAVIPARGGSKRVPRKNIVPFFGHPMIAYSIASALKCGLFDQVIVSTEDEAIGRIARDYGARFMTRPAQLANDIVGVGDVGVHVLRTLMAEGHRPAEICLLLPSCPLRRAQDILDQHEAFVRKGRPSQISVVPYQGVYPHWAVVGDEFGRGRFLFEGNSELNTQELKEAYCPTGAIWWAHAEMLDRAEHFYMPDYGIEPMDALYGFDIDTLEDLALAEVLVHGLTARDGSSPLEQPELATVPQEIIPR